MKYLSWIIIVIACLMTACPEGKYASLTDASPADQKAVEKTWQSYLSDLSAFDENNDKKVYNVAKYFMGSLLANTSVEDFKNQLKAGARRARAGAFEKMEVKAVKVKENGFLLVVAAKIGEGVVPIISEDDQIKLANLKAAVGEWKDEPTFVSDQMPKESSLLFIKSVLENDNAKINQKLAAAVALAKTKYRQEIINYQKSLTDPIVLLGLGLARIKIDGYDKSFILKFPVDSKGLTALSEADPRIFSEMMSNLSSLAADVEDPPANEVLFKVAAAAPKSIKPMGAEALYKMAEKRPVRFANAVRNLESSGIVDKVLEIYRDEIKRQGGKAPKMKSFLKKFAKEGEAEERKLCRQLLKQIQ
jgi:hypothetical protein